jgi:hypothetical protein
MKVSRVNVSQAGKVGFLVESFTLAVCGNKLYTPAIYIFLRP